VRAGQSALLRRQHSEVSQALAGEFRLHADEAAQESSNGALVTGRDGVRCLLTVPGHEYTQVGMKPVADTRRLGNDVLAGLDELRDVAALVGRSDRRQVGLPRSHPGDRERVARVALTGPPRPDPLPARELRGHLADGAARGKQEAGRRCAVRGASFDADHRVRGDLRPWASKTRICDQPHRRMRRCCSS